jgi:sphingomyelin phosphodiesterase acid-like 3
MKKILYLTLVLLITSCSNANTQSPTFLTIGDTHFNHKLEANTSYKQDTSVNLWNSTLNQFKQVIQQQKPKFILFLGDNPAHDQPKQDRNKDSTEIFQNLRETVKNNKIPLLYVPGNNEMPGGDYFPFTNDKGETPFSLDPDQGWPVINATPTCDEQSETACIQSNVKKFGYYSAYPLGKQNHLLVIALNTVIFSPEYTDKLTQQNAAQGELAWLQTQLAEAKSHKDNVYIAMHIPPGGNAYDPTQKMWASTIKDKSGETIQNSFLDIVNTYNDIIKGMFTAHTHYDAIRKIYNKEGVFTLLSVSNPGITPQHRNNPGFKLWNYDGENYNLLGSTTYWTTPEAKVWNSYTFNTQYGCIKGDSMYTCISKCNPKCIENGIKQHFSVNNKNFKIDWKNVYNAIDVKYTD